MTKTKPKGTTITKGGRLSMRDLDISEGHICLHDVKYGGESNLSVDLEPEEVARVIAALQGEKGDEIARVTVGELLKPAVKRMINDIQDARMMYDTAEYKQANGFARGTSQAIALIRRVLQGKDCDGIIEDEELI